MRDGGSGAWEPRLDGALEALLATTRRKNEVRLKQRVTSGLRQAFHRAGINAALQRVWNHEALVLFYHKVHGGPQGLWGEPVLDARRFGEHLAYLAREFVPVPLAELVRGLDTPGRLPQRAVALTFDDGYRNNLLAAAPLLRRAGIPATLFVATGLIGTDRGMWGYELELCFARHEPARLARASGDEVLVRLCEHQVPRRLLMLACVDYLKTLPHAELLRRLEAIRAELPVELDEDNRLLGWDEVRELRDYGFDIGGHTVTHPLLPNTTPEHAEREIAGCRRDLEARLGVRPTLFAFPNGDTEPHVTALVGRHFEAAVTTAPGLCTGATPRYALPRLGAPVEVADLSFEVTRLLFEAAESDLDDWEAVPRPHPEPWA